MPRRSNITYPSDLTDDQWQVVALVLRQATHQPGNIHRRRILNTIFYVLRMGCQWRHLPKSYPNWKPVYSCFRRWSMSGVWDQVTDALRVKLRYSQDRKAHPTAAIVDSQSIRTTASGQRKRGAKRL